MIKSACETHDRHINFPAQAFVVLVRPLSLGWALGPGTMEVKSWENDAFVFDIVISQLSSRLWTPILQLQLFMLIDEAL